MTKPTKWHVCSAKTHVSLGIRPVWSEFSLSAWRKLGSFATHWVHSEDSDQTGWMPRLIWVFAGCTCHFVGFVVRWLIRTYCHICFGIVLNSIIGVQLFICRQGLPSSFLVYIFFRPLSPKLKEQIWWVFCDNFAYFSVKTYVVGTRLITSAMSPHNIYFYGDLTKIILQLSSNTHLTCSFVVENTWEILFYDLLYPGLFEPRHEETCLRDLRPGKTQTILRILARVLKFCI